MCKSFDMKKRWPFPAAQVAALLRKKDSWSISPVGLIARTKALQSSNPLAYRGGHGAGDLRF